MVHCFTLLWLLPAYVQPPHPPLLGGPLFLWVRDKREGRDPLWACHRGRLPSRRDQTGADPTPWAQWTRKWTAPRPLLRTPRDRQPQNPRDPLPPAGYPSAWLWRTTPLSPLDPKPSSHGPSGQGTPRDPLRRLTQRPSPNTTGHPTRGAGTPPGTKPPPPERLPSEGSASRGEPARGRPQQVPLPLRPRRHARHRGAHAGSDWGLPRQSEYRRILCPNIILAFLHSFPH